MAFSSWRFSIPAVVLVGCLLLAQQASAQLKAELELREVDAEEAVDEPKPTEPAADAPVEPAAEADDPFGDAPPRRVIKKKVAPTKEAAEKKAEEEEEPEVPAKPAEPVNPKIVRFHLMDGSVISGELTIEEITIATDYGQLVVPITGLTSFKPGLDAYPQLATDVGGLIEQLGSDDYQTREQAHKDLAKMGLKVKSELERFKNDENAERKRHVEQLLKEFENLAEEQADGDEEGTAEPVWIRDDTVVTARFTAIGKISPQTFTVTSKYGPLTVKIADVRLMDREIGVKELVRRKVTVPGTNIVQLGFKNSGIRVDAGDKVSITADGQIVMSPWGNNMSSGPDGGQNYGWYVPNKIPGGALVAKIGSGGEEFKVGSKHTFVAKKSGILQFGVAMQAQYAQQGYSYPGQYEVRVKIEPR